MISHKIKKQQISKYLLFLLFLTVCLCATLSCQSTKVNNPYEKEKKVRADVYDFDSCIQAGFPVTRSFPPQCRTTDGRIFMNYGVQGNKEVRQGRTEKIEKNTSNSSCKDKCGDGVCQEIVCMAVGCPCAENKISCPKDCK